MGILDQQYQPKRRAPWWRRPYVFMTGRDPWGSVFRSHRQHPIILGEPVYRAIWEVRVGGLSARTDGAPNVLARAVGGLCGVRWKIVEW